MGRLVLIDSDVLIKAAEDLQDTLGNSRFNLRLKLRQPVESKYEPLTQIAEELRKHGLTLIRSSKGFRVEKFGEVKAQKITGLCTNKKAPGGCQLGWMCGYPQCDEKSSQTDVKELAENLTSVVYDRIQTEKLRGWKWSELETGERERLIKAVFAVIEDPIETHGLAIHLGEHGL